MEKFIPLSVPNLKGNELQYVKTAIESEWVSTAGPFVSEFEEKIAEYVGVKGAVACQNGTSGLHLALLAIGVKSGDAVFAPTLTFIAAVNPVKYIGADPIFMDCDDSLCMDPIKLREYCENCCHMVHGELVDNASNKIIRAAVVVHVFGNMADMESILNIANEFHFQVIEDATEALGTYYTKGKYAGKYAGTIAEVGVYSFNGNKIVTTGGGGMVVSNNERLLNYVRYLSTQAKDDLVYFVHNQIGYNYRMTNLQGAVGLAQLEQLEDFINTKQQNYNNYLSADIKLLPFREGIRSNHWFYSYMTDFRDDLIEYFTDHKIQTRPVWQLIHTLPPYLSSQNYRIQNAVFYHDKIVNVPCSTNLTKDDIDRVANVLYSFKKA